GDEQEIRARIPSDQPYSDRLEIVHAPVQIGMGEHPTRAFTQKPDSSIATGFRMLSEGSIDAFCGAGNTGAMLVGSIYSVNTIQGIIRPATCTLVPREDGGVNLLIDVGTNPDAKPDVMYQFGLLGHIYMRYLLGVRNPRVGLLNIGTEEEKGNILCQSAYTLMKDSRDFDFIGNVESRDLFKEKAEVIVTDGFTGNIILKQMEATYRMLVKRGLVDEYIQRFNYESYGGSPILGINASVVIGHGISNATAIKNMILLSANIHKAGLPEQIRRAMHCYLGRTGKED
ncbi:MAG TPA: phosphate--acyl-ACP acyltransferase, partial [Bacteroidales bacterium]|nr:phosphate--acyl-ACP acyltransferase [Bacteroidales bacterium]